MGYRGLWQAHTSLRTHLDPGGWRIIPAGDSFRVTALVEGNRVRIFWDGNTVGLGGSTVDISELESCATSLVYFCTPRAITSSAEDGERWPTGYQIPTFN